MAITVEVKNLGKRFKHAQSKKNFYGPGVWMGESRIQKQHFWAVRNIHFDLNPGRMIGIIGRNGSGKSTLLRLIGGVMRPDEGHVKLNGRLAGLLDLGANFHPDLSGRENVMVNGVIGGLTRKEVSHQLDSIVDFAELEAFIDDPLRTYSSGMKMRLAFAIAVHIEADILLIDEVLAVGDLVFRQKCFKQIEQFKKKGYVLIFVSHDSDQITNFCDEVLWLNNGRIMAYGDPKSVDDQYRSAMKSETLRRTLAAEPGEDISTNPKLSINVNRFGSQELRIMSVKLRNQEGVTVTSIDNGASLSVEMEYLTNKRIVSPIFGVEIYRSDHKICCNINTATSGISLPAIEGHGQLTLQLGRLDLVKGDYYVNVGAYEKDWAYSYDYHHNVYPLFIRSIHETKNGVLQPPFEWKIIRS